jgi:hypothetical protein
LLEEICICLQIVHRPHGKGIEYDDNNGNGHPGRRLLRAWQTWSARCLAYQTTRVGYSGGDVPNATYRNHGTHAEAIEMCLIPAVLSYPRSWNSSRFTIRLHRNRQGNDIGSAIARTFIPMSNRRPWRKTPLPTSSIRLVAWQGGDGTGAGRAVLAGRA